MGRFFDWLTGGRGKSPPVSLPPTNPAPSPGDLSTLLAAHNDYRRRYSLPYLVLNAKLTAAAQGHASAMQTAGVVLHDLPGEPDVYRRISANGYRWMVAAENIAGGFPDVASVMAGWIGSPGHRSNIVDGRLIDVGFGVSGRFWCADFGRPDLWGHSVGVSVLLTGTVHTSGPLVYSPGRGALPGDGE